MKKYILYILLLFCSMGYAYTVRPIYTTSTIHKSNYDHISNYNNYNSYNGSNSNLQRKIGYTTDYGYGFNNRNYNISYDKPYTPVGSGRPGPRKSPSRPYSGDVPEWLDGIWITFNSNWPRYVDEDYWDELKAYDEDLYNYAQEWYELNGYTFPGNPEDPFADPVGDAIWPLLLLSIIYIVYIKNKLSGNECMYRSNSKK